MTAFNVIWHWRKYPVAFINGVFVRNDRKGQRCRVIARGGLGSILVEFEDGWRVVTSRYAVRAP